MRREAESVAAWLDYAQSDLAYARLSVEAPVSREIACFHAQQAVEKAIKAVLISFDIAPPKTHSIEYLIDLLPPDVPRPADLQASRSLTGYASVSRYPWSGEPVSEEEYRQALRLAEAVVAWAEAVVGRTDT